MRTVFFGTPELAIPSLAAVASRHEVMAAVCQPDKPQGRNRQIVPQPVKLWAQEHGIPVVQPAKLNDGAFEAWLSDLAPDVCPLVAYGRLLRRPILDVPAHGFINVHPSLLPRHRGPSPIQTAILEGDRATGITIMRLDEGMDTGDILLQAEMPILPEDTTAWLTERMATVGAELLVRALMLIEAGDAVFKPQNDERATVTRIFGKADGRIDWSVPAERIHNLVRAAVPWPMAQCVFRGEDCKIHKTEVVDRQAEAAPGVVVEVGKEYVLVATGEKLLAIVTFQPPGKRAMSMGEYLRGRPVQVGDRFE